MVPWLIHEGLPASQLTRRRTHAVTGAAAVMAITLAGAACGSMFWHHQQAQASAHKAQEFAAAARQGVTTLLTLSAGTAQADVQRVVDNSTGDFRDEFAQNAADFTKLVAQSQVQTSATVNAVAVKSTTTDTAVVLVAVSSEVTNSAGDRQGPRSWRLVVTVAEDNEQLRMSSVEFVP